MYNLVREGEVTNLVLPTNHATFFRGLSITIIPVDVIQGDSGGKVNILGNGSISHREKRGS